MCVFAPEPTRELQLHPERGRKSCKHPAVSPYHSLHRNPLTTQREREREGDLLLATRDRRDEWPQLRSPNFDSAARDLRSAEDRKKRWSKKWNIKIYKICYICHPQKLIIIINFLTDLVFSHNLFLLLISEKCNLP